MGKSIKIKFWGTRGSNPSANNNMSTFGGETTCLELRTADNELIVFDMGTGIIQLGNKLVKEKDSPKDIHILVSHFHWDHIIGFASFKPVYMGNFNIIVYARQPDHGSLKDVFEDMLNDRYWPVPLDKLAANVEFRVVKPLVFKLNDKIAVEARSHPHPGGAFGYRILIDGKIITFITDIEHPIKNPIKSSIDLARNSDILIHEAHFSPEDLANHIGWGHSSWEEAVMVAKEAKVKKLIMTHHSPDYDDSTIAVLEANAKAKFPNASMARSEYSLTLPV